MFFTWVRLPGGVDREHLVQRDLLVVLRAVLGREQSDGLAVQPPVVTLYLNGGRRRPSMSSTVVWPGWRKLCQFGMGLMIVTVTPKFVESLSSGKDAEN